MPRRTVSIVAEILIVPEAAATPRCKARHSNLDTSECASSVILAVVMMSAMSFVNV